PSANGHADDDSGSGLRTILQADELSALCAFMTAAVEEDSPRALVERALATVHTHTWANVTGFLSLDPDEPLPKLVLPEKASVDTHLSRQLTRRVQQEGRPVWLARQGTAGGSGEDSLVSYADALCVPLLVEGVPLGALHVYRHNAPFGERQVRFCEVLAGYLAGSLHVLRSRRMLAAENRRLRGHGPAAGQELIGDSPALLKLREQISRMAGRPGTVLIIGESGVGKELVASALHRESLRADGPLVTVNCAAIAASLSDAELFGHCEGTFTDAKRDRPGYFQQADEGTLFLDEIGELSLEVQAKLLRVIEGKGFRRVGGTAEERVDVRVIAATNRDLAQMVREERFRGDLYYRLGVPIRVPALREHAEDVPALVEHFLRRLAGQYRRPLGVTPAAMDRLRQYPWPGNVRQLWAVLENAVALTDATILDAADLLLPDATVGEPRPAEDGAPVLPCVNLEQLEVLAIRQALRQTGGNVTAAAELLGIHRDTLGLKMKKYEIKRGEGGRGG
ncbi:MAG TPA: sigma 54-interacting transcriptional regulator, partial [Gemmataceae bacterium]|nr:sigma 54-interacting transcriptional regulator [Gemmataceae bacterium]